MGRHSHEERKEYKKRGKHKLKEKLEGHADIDVGQGSGSETTTVEKIDNSTVDASQPFEKDILYTAMMKFRESRQIYYSMEHKFTYNQDTLLFAPDRDRRTRY